MDLRNLHAMNIQNHSKIRGFLVAFIFTISSLTGFSQTNFSLGISGGYDKSINYLDGVSYKNTDVLPDYNFGVDGILAIGEKMRVRAEAHYSNLSFTRRYNFTSDNENRLDYSKMAISNLEFSPKFEYRLLQAGKLDVFASAGFNFMFELGKYERTFLANGEKAENNYISDDFLKTQAGAVGGFVLKYNLSDFTAITLMPDYTYYFDKFYSKNNYVMQRIGVNLGFEWKF